MQLEHGCSILMVWSCCRVRAGVQGKGAVVAQLPSAAHFLPCCAVLQINEYQLQLMKVRQSEEDKGGGAADARRWNGLRTIVEARAMLKTVFRSASQHKAQASGVARNRLELSRPAGG